MELTLSCRTQTRVLATLPCLPEVQAARGIDQPRLCLLHNDERSQSWPRSAASATGFGRWNRDAGWRSHDRASCRAADGELPTAVLPC